MIVAELILCCSSPSDATNIGMNIGEGTYQGPANITATIGDMWYNSEIALYPGYGNPNPDMSKFDLWGHFTQVIWKGSEKVGCYSAACSRKDGAANAIGSGFFTVCMYSPPANFPGGYSTNVGTPLGRASQYGA